MSLSILGLLSFSLAAVLCTPLADQQVGLKQVPGHQVELKRGSCPMFWYEFSGRCYRYVAAHRTWAGSEDHCLDEGGNLSSIHSLEEINFIENLINNFDPTLETWIGLNDHYSEGVWTWSDGTKVNFTQWRSSEPNGGTKENCVATTPGANKKWGDVLCSYGRPSVCASRRL